MRRGELRRGGWKDGVSAPPPSAGGLCKHSALFSRTFASTHRAVVVGSYRVSLRERVLEMDEGVQVGAASC